MKRYACHELGVCQGRPGVGCTCNLDSRLHRPYYFAPRVIARYRRIRIRWTNLMLEAAIVLGAGLLMGMACGWLQVKGWL